MIEAVHRFFTDPEIIDDAKIPLRVRTALHDAPDEPFMERFRLRMNRMGGAVFDGDRLIASIGQFENLIVHDDYRGLGIATELVFQMMVHNPENLPTRKAVRTPAGASVYRKALERFMGGQNVSAES